MSGFGDALEKVIMGLYSLPGRNGTIELGKDAGPAVPGPLAVASALAAPAGPSPR